jgi:hypothetical protein
MLKGKMTKTVLSHAARNFAFSIKTTTGTPSGTTTAGKGYCYNVYDDTWYLYSLSLDAWVNIG